MALNGVQRPFVDLEKNFLYFRPAKSELCQERDDMSVVASRRVQTKKQVAEHLLHKDAPLGVKRTDRGFRARAKSQVEREGDFILCLYGLSSRALRSIKL